MNAIVAVLVAIHVSAGSATFQFRHAPQTVRAGYTTRPLSQCGSGAHVPLRGAKHFVVRFLPAQTALAYGKTRRLPGSGSIRELAKVCDFESDLAWAIGLDRRRGFTVTRRGSSVTVRFR